jgi:hypothetical protein
MPNPERNGSLFQPVNKPILYSPYEGAFRIRFMIREQVSHQLDGSGLRATGTEPKRPAPRSETCLHG